MLIRLFHWTVAIALLTGAPVAAQRQSSLQVDAGRERARPAYTAGMGHLRVEAFDAAAKAFQEAIELDPTFDMAYYMLGRTHMMTKNYASAVLALTRCRDLHVAESSSQLLTNQEIQSIRRRRVDEINVRINDLQAALDAGGRRDADRIRAEIEMLRERKRHIEDAERQLTPQRAVPSYVSLALGSAYFRSGKLADAEQAYLAALAADSKVGEAHSNLAVVYMETGRLAEAERAVKDAEKAGFKVLPALKEEINKRKRAGS
jgi:Tfp pilus assembly protein PilF